MKLFNDGNLDAYAGKRIQKIKEEIEQFSDAEITVCDFDQFRIE